MPHRRWVLRGGFPQPLARRALAVALVYFSGSLLLVSSALASDYHGVGKGYNASGNHGASAYLCITKLWLNDYVDDHVNNTLWVLMDPHDQNYWTETGIVNGDDVTSVPIFYWADDNSHGYTPHFSNLEPILGDEYYANIEDRNANWWNVSINGWTTGSGSWQNTSIAYGLKTGVEFTNPSTSWTQESGSSQSTSWYDTSGGSNFGWVPGSPPVEADSPSGVFWYQKYNYLSEAIGQPFSC